MSKCIWRAFDMIFFDCDSTLAAIEGIDELAKSRGLFEEVQRLTNAAMDGEVHLESIYDQRLQLLHPTRREIRQVERLYRETVVPDAQTVIQALQMLGKTVFIVSGGLYEAVCPFGVWLGIPKENIRAVEVEYNSLSGAWWDYQRDRWGRRPDVNYLKHDAGPLVRSQGKPAVVEALKGDQPGRSMLIGDGMSDLAAQSAVDKLVGFGGVVARPGVKAGADIFITANSLAPVLALATSAAEKHKLLHSQFADLLQKGLTAVEHDAVLFKHMPWRTAVLDTQPPQPLRRTPPDSSPLT